MDIFFRKEKELIKMQDNIKVGGTDNKYLVTSTLTGKERVLAKFETEKEVINILDKIDMILDKAINDNKKAVSIRMPFNEE